MIDLRYERKANGLCVQCGAVLDREGSYCKRCNDRANIIKHERVCRFHEEGKCSTCGEELDREGWFCSKCANNLKLRSRIRSAERRANGLCVQCATPTDGGSYCQRCRNMRMERYYRKKQRG